MRRRLNLCCRSTWLTAQMQNDLKRQVWWAGVTHQVHHKRGRIWNEQFKISLECVRACCFLAEVDRAARGGNARQRTAADLCQQARPVDGRSSVGAGGNSPSANHPGSYVADPGLLSRHCRRAAGSTAAQQRAEGLSWRAHNWIKVDSRKKQL